jgi:hypothetical protein
VRRVTQSEFVRQAVRRATEQLPSFQRIFEEGILWQLQRAALDEAVEIPGTYPPLFVIETIAWRAEGIPRLRIGYHNVPGGIEVVMLALDKPPTYA